MSDAQPREPRQRVAPGTHPVELSRLALQEQSHPDCRLLGVQAVIWLFRAYNAVVHTQAEELRPYGLSPSAFNALMALHNTAGGSLEPCQLAERLLVSRPSMSGLLDTLEGKGLIRRTPHHEDRRRVLVALTEKGRALLDEHFPHHYRRQDAQLAALDDDDLETLVSLLRRIGGAVPDKLATDASILPERRTA